MVAWTDVVLLDLYRTMGGRAAPTNLCAQCCWQGGHIGQVPAIGLIHQSTTATGHPSSCTLCLVRGTASAVVFVLTREPHVGSTAGGAPQIIEHPQSTQTHAPFSALRLGVQGVCAVCVQRYRFRIDGGVEFCCDSTALVI